MFDKLLEECRAGRAVVGSALAREQMESERDWFHLETRTADYSFSLWDDYPSFKAGSHSKGYALNHTFVSEAFVALYQRAQDSPGCHSFGAVTRGARPLHHGSRPSPISPSDTDWITPGSTGNAGSAMWELTRASARPHWIASSSNFINAGFATISNLTRTLSSVFWSCARPHQCARPCAACSSQPFHAAGLRHSPLGISPMSASQRTGRIARGRCCGSGNSRIFANVQRITEGPQDRILLIIGAGHLGLLRHAFETSPEYQLVEVGDVLGPGCDAGGSVNPR